MGTMVIETLVQGEKPYPGLVTLEYVKKMLGVTDSTYDVFLQAQIIWISERVEEYCAREFKVRDYTYLIEDLKECDGGYESVPPISVRV